MALQPKTKKTEAKKAPKVKAKKAPKVSKSTRVTKDGQTRHGMATALILEKKWTDEEIHAKVNKVFAPLQLIKVACSVIRANLNESLSANQKLERIVEVDGKKMPKSKAPAKAKTSKKRKPVDPKNDPLSRIAGIKPKAKAKAKAKPKVKPPTEPVAAEANAA